MNHCYHSISKKPAVKPTFVKIPPKRKTREASVNTDISFAPQENVIMETVSENISAESCYETNIEENESYSDPDYYPLSDGSQSENFNPESLEETRKTKPISDRTVFSVFWSCLTQLLQRCPICLSSSAIERSFAKGTMVIVDLLCKYQHRTKWSSQTINNGMSTGNINISAGILFSGNAFQRIKELINITNVAFISQSTFCSIPKKFLYPAIHLVYTTNRALLFESVKEKSKIYLLGDLMCESPGYNAKYGTYTLMNNQSGHILDFHISHVRVAGKSQRMELDGFKRAVDHLQECSIEIGSITTDRHKQI